MKKILALILAILIIAAYVGISFYGIEHTYSSNGNFLITKQSKLKECLNDNIESFDNIVNSVLEEYSDTATHDYYLEDMADNDDANALIENCNVEWIRIQSDIQHIVFYQTTKSRETNQIILGYMCYVDFDGEHTWTITEDYPDVNKKETLGVKLYNIIFNLFL
ncbi:MAG: hypothetical protein LUF26_05545 [Firmicutes bacterium]|nr:hypothetical protein [Bacillota bacterium]